MRSAFPLVLLGLAPLLGSCAAPGGAGPVASPNIVLFIVDDLGWQDLSEPFHVQRTPFNDRYRTPHVEALARRGVKFTEAYASAPVCTPTRTSLMTGRSPAATHITYWILHADRDQSASFPEVKAPEWNVNGLQPGDVTLPGVLRDAGYRTIHVGKAHLGAKGTPGGDPANLGFDVNVAGHGAGGPGGFLGKDGFGAHKEVWAVPGLEEYHGRDVYLTEVLAEKACDEIERAVDDGRPFFLHMSPYAVHAPITANPRYLDHYTDLDPREAAYATMIETVDAALGSIVATLEAEGVAEDTIVIFTSDNGGLSAHARGGEPHTHNAPLRSGKGSAYEGGVRVPQIIAWPGVTTESISDQPVITHDLFPTVLSMAGVECPPAHAPRVEGVDLTPLVRDASAALAPRKLFWHMPHFWGVNGPGIEPYTAMRWDHWKAIYRHRDRGWELYDLSTDLGETVNLADDIAYWNFFAGHTWEMARWVEAVGAQMSRSIETGETISVRPIPDPALCLD